MNRRVVSTVIALAALTSACSRDDSKVQNITLGPRAIPQLGPGVSTQVASDAGMYTMAQVFDAEARGRPAPTDPTAAAPVAAAPASAAPAAPQVNPDDAILEQTRRACGGCFSSLRAGAGFGPPTRSAHVSLMVVPTGSVSRAEVTSNDTTDPGVLDCIKSTAQAASFSDNGGGPLRSYAIDVQVSAHGTSGGR